MMKLALGVLTGWALSLACLAAGVVKEYVVAPRLETPVWSVDENNDFFQDCPVYQVETRQQVLRHGHLKPEDNLDFALAARVAWTAEALFIRLDVTDDLLVPGSGAAAPGDHFRVSFMHLSAGPYPRTEAPWSVLLFPQVKERRCSVALEVPQPETAQRVGPASGLEAKLFLSQEAYTIVLRVPTTTWTDPPRAAAFMKFQVLAYDADDKDQPAVPDHVFALFPVGREVAQPAGAAGMTGQIHFVDQVWLSLRAESVVTMGARLRLLADLGNLTRDRLDLAVHLEAYEKSGQVVKAFPLQIPLEPGKVQQRVPVDLDLGDVPPNLYRVRATAGLFHDPVAVVLHNPPGMIYLPQQVELQEKRTDNRPLLAQQRRELGLATLRQMAGGGTVLWSVGQYDASSQEFAGKLYPPGPYELNVTAATTAAALPWALFGGLDRLDGMNEPLVLKLDPALFKDEGGLAPAMPEFVYRAADNAKKRKAIRARRLLLIGLTYPYVDDESAPEIRVTSGRNVLVHQRLQSTDAGGPGTRRAYVLRVWLEDTEREVSIANVAAYGRRADIDFVALLGPGAATDYEAGQPALRFSGSDEAALFTRQLSTSLYFMRHYLVDRNGQAYGSLPGGRQDVASDRDFGLLMQELARWGALDEARRMATQLPVRQARARDAYTRRGEMTLGYPTMVVGLHELYRKLGHDATLVQPMWLSAVHLPVTDMVGSLTRNRFGLVEASGPLGVVDANRRGATLPMAMAVRTALARASDMAGDLGYAQSAPAWRESMRRLDDAVRSQLQAGGGGLPVAATEHFAASFGLPAQKGLRDVLPARAWLFGRYDNGQPILYNANVRTYDTPYVFAGVPLLLDSRGYLLDEATRTGAQTTLNWLYIVSPLMDRNSQTFIQGDLLDYNNSDQQLWLATTALLLDSMPTASRLVNAYVRYTFDEYAGLPQDAAKLADIEISPYTFEEKLNADPTTLENTGASYDDLNVMSATSAMRMARLIAGVDDTRGEELRLIPRLPETWQQVQATGWLVNHNSGNGRVTTLDYQYQRLPNDRYLLKLKSARQLTAVTVRFGPFPANVRRVELMVEGGARERLQTTLEGGMAWLTRTFRNTTDLEVTARPTF